MTFAPTTLAVIDQITAQVAHATGADQNVVAQVAPSLLTLGARAQLDAVIHTLEADDGCRGYADSLTGERRVGAHMAVGAMVAKLKQLRLMTEGT